MEKQNSMMTAALKLAGLAAMIFALNEVAAQGVAAVKFPPIPVPTKLPAGELGKMVALGRDIVNHTASHPMSRQYVGNRMNCASCHLDGGTNINALSFLGVASAYPTYAPREDETITLEDRNLNCFMRSMNGVRPSNGSDVSVAIAAYMTWLSEGYPIKMSLKGPFGPNSRPSLQIDVATADAKHGAALYTAACASCHGADGAGMDALGPLWGPQSYNSGAGMAQTLKLATYLKGSMPLDKPNLSDKEALDLAAYINAQPRPKFEFEEHLGSSK